MNEQLLDRHPRGPEEHKAAVQALGLPNVRELLVLAPGNDPFYKGTPAQRRDAEWFADVWQRFGYTQGVHLRRVHYQVLSTGSLTSNGLPYENTEACWKALCEAGAAARLLGLVDAEAFVDRRNPEPVINRRPRVEPGEPGWSWSWSWSERAQPSWSVPTIEPPLLSLVDQWLLPFVPRWELPSIGWGDLEWWGLDPLPERPDVEISGYGYDPDDQPVLLEVWVEKSTMEDVLGPLCRALNVNLVTGVGNQSITAAVRLLRRAERHGKPAHVLYVSDFDPAGEHMPVAVARQAQFWRDQLKVDVPITLDPLVLTREQVTEFGLPRVPIKETDRRAAGFEARNGQGAVELDALEALHPGTLARIVRAAARPYVDLTLATALTEARSDAERIVEDRWRDDIADLQTELGEVGSDVRDVVQRHEEWLAVERAELDADLGPERQELDDIGRELRVALADVVAPFRQRLDAVADRVNAKVEQRRELITATVSDLNAELAAQEERLAGLAVEAERVVSDFDPELPDRPEPAEPDVDRGALLYDSRRCWRDQLAAYRRAKGASTRDGVS